MSRPSSNNGAANSTPLATTAAEEVPAETEPSSADTNSRTELDGGSSFGDWREQLRDRIREIRARKLSAKHPVERDASGLSRPADAARSEKLQTAREHAATMNDEPVQGSPSVPPTLGADNLTELESAEPEAQVTSAQEMDLVRVADNTYTENSTPTEIFLELPVPEEAAPLFHETPTPAHSNAVPLLQDDTQFIDENPLNETGEGSPERLMAKPNAPRETPPPVDGFRTKIPDWAKLEWAPESDTPATQPAPPTDLDAIPSELSEIDIPSWALPRQSGNEAAEAFAANAPGQLNADALLAGNTPEQALSKHETGALTIVEAVAEKNPPPAAAATIAEPKDSAESEGLVQHDIHIISEHSASGSSPPRTNSEEPPGKDTLATTDDPSATTNTSPLDFESQANITKLDIPELESSFEQPIVDSGTAEPENERSSRVLGLIETAEPISIETAVMSASRDAPMALEPQPATDKAMEWDLEATSDPGMALNAQRDPMDPTAPISDRLFSTLADALVLTTIAVLLVFGGASAAGTSILSFVQAAPVPFIAAWSIFGLGYGIFFVGTCGQTLGKMAMRIRVIESNHFRVGYGKATVRSLSYAAAILPAGLGLILALKDAEHRALHDRLSGTRVVKA